MFLCFFISQESLKRCRRSLWQPSKKNKLSSRRCQQDFLKMTTAPVSKAIGRQNYKISRKLCLITNTAAVAIFLLCQANPISAKPRKLTNEEVLRELGVEIKMKGRLLIDVHLKKWTTILLICNCKTSKFNEYLIFSPYLVKNKLLKPRIESHKSCIKNWC